MVLIKFIRSVPKSSWRCLDVRKAYYCAYTLKMNGTTTLSSEFVNFKPIVGCASTSTLAKEVSDKPQIKPHANDATIEELVFYPKGQHPVDNNKDAQTIALENANYNAAIEELTNLQSNEVTVRKNNKLCSVSNTIKYLERSGLPLASVEQLSVIHVAGTKGKGSTCALTESILRQYGARTGFFSSPHLLSTNERIRINGDPLSKQKFTDFFWLVYNRLRERRENELDMPPFFMFLTILGFHVFVAEAVEVLVLEVGLGGEMDCTNILKNVRTVGITSLGLEHTDLLGNTLPQIAWQKAGIMKPDAHVYTHVTQPECLKVIYERAAERKAKLFEVPTTEAYFKYNEYGDFLESCNDYVRLNGALAIQLSYDWLSQTRTRLHRDIKVNEMHMSAEVLRGLVDANWPGRCQLVNYENMRLHLDGAHTVESIRVCCNWFLKSTKQSKNPKILIFNRTGSSDIKNILMVLQEHCDFDMVCFVPNLADAKAEDPNQTTPYCSAERQRARARSIAATWQQLCEAKPRPNRGQMYHTLWDAFVGMRTIYPAAFELDVLVTGSIHLLGATILALSDFRLANLPPIQASITSPVAIAAAATATNAPLGATVTATATNATATNATPTAATRIGSTNGHT